MTIPAIQAIATNADPPPPRSPASKRSEAPPAAPSPYVNPTLRLDAELGLVVMEFRDDSGSLTATIPSERQIEAYRAHQEPSPGRTTADDAQPAEPAAPPAQAAVPVSSPGPTAASTQAPIQPLTQPSTQAPITVSTQTRHDAPVAEPDAG